VTNSSETCETCKFFVRPKGSKGPGDCRRYAPRASIHTDQVRFIKVPASCWCGDYESNVDAYTYGTDLPPKPTPPPPIDIIEGVVPEPPKPPPTHTLTEGDEKPPVIRE